MKIIVFTDTHANLPALQAVQRQILAEGYDLAVHTGDAIDIGPYPAESLDLLFGMPRLEMIMGNHDAMYVFGIPDPLSGAIDANEAEHCRWTAGRLDSACRHHLSQWPHYRLFEIDGLKVAFAHYGLTASMDAFTSPVVTHPTPSDLDRIFGRFGADLVFYGHSHPFSDITGRARYINPGALGCFTEPIARYCVLNTRPDSYSVAFHSVPYDDTELFHQYHCRQVPARQFILKEFFGRTVW